MTEYTPGQIAWAARLVCMSTGIDPDCTHHTYPALWHTYEDDARRLLAELERQQVKAVPNSMPDTPEGNENTGWTHETVRLYSTVYACFPVCPEYSE